MTIMEIGLQIVFWMGIGVLIVTRLLSWFKIKYPPAIYIVFLVPLLAGLFVHGYLTLGFINFTVLFLLSAIIPAVGETLALKMDLGGGYQYDTRLGPALPGGLPVIIAVMWAVINIVIFWAVSSTLIALIKTANLSSVNDNKIIFDLIFCTMGAAFAVIFDLVMDPVMTKGGLWSWKRKGKWHGIPLSNYFGWFISTFMVYFIYTRFFNLFDPKYFLIFRPSVQILFSLLFSIMLLDLSITAIERKITGPALIGLTFSTGSSILIIFVVLREISF
ncbi:MAG: carotenoid biosynthesis protein [Candidatus Electryonea clarkiae]|nr:carotenoid biosynthesis protein [Candidatus Electryonea clarkiae]